MILLIYLILVFFNLFTKEPAYEELSKEIIEEHKNEMLLSQNCKISSLGGSSNKGIKKIHLGINVLGPGSIVSGRKLFVSLVNDLIFRYNNNENIRPYLLDYPFNEKNIDYEISYTYPNNIRWVLNTESTPDQQIAIIMMCKGKLYYDIKENSDSPLETIYEETFEEAVRKVQSGL